MRPRQPTKPPKTNPHRARLRAATRAIRTELSNLDYLISGTLTERFKACGKPNCRCATDASARHGPYYEWGFMEGGKLKHRLVPADRAELMRVAIANYKRARQLLSEWEALSANEIIAPAPLEQ
jgi:hypothetical protein